MVTRVYDFGKIDWYGRGRKVNSVKIDVSLKTNKDGFPVFTASGGIANARGTDYVAAGQILDEIKSVPRDNATFKEIKRLWKAYHLNDMHAGTKAQEDALKKAGIRDYGEAVAFLKKKGLYEVRLTATEKKYNPRYADKPYRYGSGWLYRPIPAKDLNIIKSIVRGV